MTIDFAHVHWSEYSGYLHEGLLHTDAILLVVSERESKFL